MKSLYLILALSGTSIEFRPLSFELLLSSPDSGRVIQSAQVIIYGNQKHSHLNAIKAVQLMVDKQLLISTSLINPFGTSVIDQHVRESTVLIGFYHFFPRAE